MQMLNVNAVPTRLRRLALLWFIVGLLSLLGRLRLTLDMGLGAMNVGILGLAFGPGLVLAWRWVPLAIRWISWVTITVFFVLTANGVINGGVSGWASAIFSAALICLLLEQLYILRLPAVRRYYEASCATEVTSRAAETTHHG